MDELDTLASLREKRLREAQTAVYVANQRIDALVQEVEKEKEKLAEYEKKLPELIEQLYLDVIGKKVDVPYVQEKQQMELKLIQKKDVLLNQVKEVEDQLAKARVALQEALVHLSRQERKKEGMSELLDARDKRRKLEEDKKLAKVMDELASLKYVR